jgi:[acyl-carrier-protein] S-malonyltransferase
VTIGVIFPGQGSQKTGMFTDIYAEFPSFRMRMEEASEVLGYDLWALISDPTQEAKLNQTEFTQPAILATSVACFQLFSDEISGRVSYLAGHSLGEYSALVCAGSLRFEDALKLVQKRGQLMQSAVPAGVGAMAAILGLSDDQVIQACESVKGAGLVSPVNFNCPGQVVIAGHLESVNQACEAAKALGAKMAKQLPVSVPSHCALMEPAGIELQRTLKAIQIRSPLIHVIHNVDVQSHVSDEAIRAALVAQLSRPVRWVETIQSFVEKGVTQFIECGPGKVLASLNKRISDLPVTSVGSVESLASLSEFLK